MPTRSTVVVRGLPELTKENDVKSFIDIRVPKVEPKVFPLVADTQNAATNYRCTTVEINHDKRALVLKLNGEDFLPIAGSKKSKIQIDAKLFGSVTLAEHESPEFDIYFVHGLEGDVFSSWVNEHTWHMWPRDSLPQQCINQGVRGRFSTIGYDAKVLDAGDPKTIQSAAESILAYIRADRPLDCTRPIFFVCHSLGGIVLTQALVLALARPAIKPEYEFLQHMVKGVAYFGVPFQGSPNADAASPFYSLVGSLTGRATSFITDLKSYGSKKLPGVMMLFNNIRNEEKIEVLLFVEKKPDGPSKVATRTSATLPFQPTIAPIEVDANHRNMVKFAGGAEARHTISEIVRMIKKQLRSATAPTPAKKQSDSSIPVLPVRGYTGKTRGKDENKGFTQLVRFDTVFVVDDTGSMQAPADSKSSIKPKSRWDVLTKSLQYIANIAAEHDKDGVDIYFLISDDLNDTNLTDGQKVLDLLGQVDLEEGIGGTYFQPVLADILGPYIGRYENFYQAKMRREKAAKVKPINVIVLTDGKADDEKTTEEFIVKIGKQLDHMNAPDSQVGIMFVQVGDDHDAAAYLKRLDNDLKKLHGVRDFVDTKTFKDLLAEDPTADFAQHLRRILLGAVNKEIDDDDED